MSNSLTLFKDGNLGTKQMQELLRELDAPSYRFRIQKLQKQLDEVDDLMHRLGATELNINNSNYITVANDAYNHGMFNLQKGVGYEFSFNGINEDAVQRILNSDWSGQNYSQRIWQNASDLGTRIKDEMVMGLLTGKTEREMSEELSHDFLVGYNNARRLIATESCFVYNDSIMQSYRDMGIDEYVFMAVHDSKTSKICRKLDRKTFKVSEMQVGVNCPPMHPWCRSVTAPKIDDDIEFKRRAYNPQTGEYEIVSDKENYARWLKKTHVSKNLIQRMSSENKIVFPPSKGKIKKDEYKSLRDKLTSIGYRISGFKEFDGDVDLLIECVEATKPIVEKYKWLFDENNIHRIELCASSNLYDEDYGLTTSRSTIVHFNQKYYRNKEFFRNIYGEDVQKGLFPKGTDYKSVIIHELGHAVSNYYKIDSLDIAMKVSGLSKDDLFKYLSSNLSIYSVSRKNGSEIISEVFSDYYNNDNPTRFSLKFIEELDKIILEKQGS